MADSSYKLKHLEFIQGAIGRMAANSFLLKAWSVTLVAALFALAPNDVNTKYFLVTYVPIVVFWILDGYFLWQERLFRALYNHIRKLDEGAIDFSMDTTPFRSGKGIEGWSTAVFSITLIPFHGVLLGAIVVVMVIQIIN